MQLHPFQIDTNREVWRQYQQGRKAILLQAPTGSGKTVMGAHLIKMRREFMGESAIVLAHRREIVKQTADKLEALGLVPEIVMAGHAPNPWGNVQVASRDTLASRRKGGTKSKNAHFMVIDECFPAGTMVSTARGEKPIEKIIPGELVDNATGIGRVLSLFKSSHLNVIKVGLSDGTVFRCTSDHPIFTYSSGWTKAGELARGERLFGKEAVANCNAEFRPTLLAHKKSSVKVPQSEKQWIKRRFLLNILLQEAGELHEKPRRSGEGVGIIATHGTQAATAGRKRKALARTSNSDTFDPWRRLARGARSQDLPETSGRISSLLQVGFGEPNSKDRDRVGWKQPLHVNETRAGSKEGCFASLPWVESVEIEELSRAEPVYNLRVSGHPSYFANGVLVHNCHLIGKGSRYETIAREHLAGGGILLGLTATPIRTDGYGLGNLFESMVRAPDVPWLIKHGFLCQPRHVWGKAPSTKNLGGGHDFNQRLVEESMEPLIGDVVKNWMRHGADRATIVFASGVDHSLHLVERFKQANISAQHVDGNTENEVRDQIFAHSRDAEIQIISNADVYIEGADFPWISCAVIARITKSLARYLQMGGRPMRTYPGKEDFMLIDHGGHYERFGPLWLARDWELSTDDKMQERMEAKRKAEQKLQVRCPQCGLMHSRRNCPICNAVAREAQDRYFIEAMLEEVTVAEWEKRDARRGHPNRLRDAAPVDKQRWYSGFLYLESERGKARGWAEHRFREKFSVWPKNMKQIASHPTPDVLAFDKHMRIRYAKSKQKALDAANTKL